METILKRFWPNYRLKKTVNRRKSRSKINRTGKMFSRTDTCTVVIAVLTQCSVKAQSHVLYYNKLRQGTKLTFFLRRHLAPKYSKVVAKSKKLVAIFFRNENKKY